jgi:polysaccharide biosynthesis protein PslF
LPTFHDRIRRLAIAPNVDVAPIDKTVARQAVRQTCGWSDDTAIIAFFGFLHPVKGLEILFNAFKQVLAEHPYARLLLIGGVESLALVGEQATNYWQTLHTTVADLELSKAVHFTGYVSAETASHYLSGADVGVLPFNHGVTLKSGSLLALLAHALPVIATQANPSDRELEDCLSFVSPRDGYSLTLALNELLSDRARRDYLSQAGLSLVQTMGWNAIATTHAQIYHSALENPHNVDH